MKKRGQGLPMKTVVVIIIAIIVLAVVIIGVLALSPNIFKSGNLFFNTSKHMINNSSAEARGLTV